MAKTRAEALERFEASSDDIEIADDSDDVVTWAAQKMAELEAHRATLMAWDAGESEGDDV